MAFITSSFTLSAKDKTLCWNVFWNNDIMNKRVEKSCHPLASQKKLFNSDSRLESCGGFFIPNAPRWLIECLIQSESIKKSFHAHSNARLESKVFFFYSLNLFFSLLRAFFDLIVTTENEYPIVWSLVEHIKANEPCREFQMFWVFHVTIEQKLKKISFKFELSCYQHFKGLHTPWTNKP